MSVYPYYKADGNPCLFQVRFDPPHPKAKDGKTFQVWHPVPDGFVAGSPPGLKPLYRPQGTPLDHLKAAEKIVVVEGEKCCEALQAEVGTTSSVTTWPGGSAAWQKANWKPLAGKHVILLADADEPGRKCMVEIAHHLRSLGNGELQLILPEGDTKEDVADWIVAGNAQDRIKALLADFDPEGKHKLGEGKHKAGELSASEPFPRKDAEALKAALEAEGVEVRYNSRAYRDEFRRGEDAWEEMSDHEASYLQDTIAAKYHYVVERGVSPLHYGEDAWRRSLNAILRDRRVDPFKEWLESLPPWDKEKRLDFYLDDLFSAGRLELVQWVGRYIFLGPVLRTYEPGAKMDEMPVLIAPQGAGKSTLLSHALPPEAPEWFTDSVMFNALDKEFTEALQGRVIAEASEMIGSTRADLERMKVRISRTNDGSVRLAYRRNPGTMLRRCAMVGTTNSDASLPNDPTGLRRFVPIRLQGANMAVEPFMADIRPQLWAEALMLHRQGVSPRLPRELMPAAAAAAESNRNRDTLLEDAIRAILDEGKGKGWTLEGWAVAVHLAASVEDAARLQQREQKRLGAALANVGLAKKREQKEGKRSSIWEMPDRE